MEWSWLLFFWCLATVVVIAVLRGWRPRFRDFRLWGRGVTPEQRRRNLAGLGLLLALAALVVLFRQLD